MKLRLGYSPFEGLVLRGCHWFMPIVGIVVGQIDDGNLANLR